MPERLHLPAKHRAALETLIEKHLSGVEVWAYGSRVNGCSHDGSDLDLVLRGPGLKEIPTERLANFGEAVRESMIPFLVEARDWARVPKRFYQEIEREYVVLMEAMETADFRRVALADVIDLILSSVDKKSKDNEKAIRLCNYMDVYNNTFITDEIDFMAATATDHEVVRCSLTRGDVVITKDSEKHDDIGVPALVRHGVADLVCGYHLAILRPRQEKVIGDYLVYALSAPQVQHQFHAYANGVTRFGLRKADIGLVEVPLPAIPEQRTIARFLSELDDKIELNRRMNKTLGAVARAIFKDWFVDFGPTRAKVEGRASYLPQDLWRLFPDELDNENKPMGWRVAPLTELAEVNPESWSRKNAPAEVDYVDLANTKWGTIESTQRFLWKDAPSRARRILRPGDTIVGLVRPGNGSFAFIGSEGLTGSTGFAVLRPRHSRFTQLVNLNATAPENIERLANLADGAAYPAVRPEVVGATQVVVPNDAVATRFSELVSPILNHMESNKRENHTLAQTHGLLLPKLMSGEIRLRDAEKNVEAIT
ncbi:MAG: restriction endonuclease subunit S [Gammaproteobacteria bacterium]|nr:restriction endonuclease subunit S [Gammaproteobacteria bacterium]MDE0508602.1 restriction endonuclease subunit S [Gammaproteobacteria bacterium]